MATVGADLDWCQTILGDAIQLGQDGTLWTRQDLRYAYNDAYRRFATLAQSIRRFVILDVPGRMTFGCAYEWEPQVAQRGTTWVWGWQTVGYAATSLWEVQHLEGVTPESGGEGLTQPWERAYANPFDTPYRFALPRNNERIAAMWYDHRRLAAIDVRELDSLWRSWMSLGDYPLAWTQGTGRNRTFELYEIVTTYQQGYSSHGLQGTVRQFSGSRTWETGTQLYGVPRRIESSARQYLVEGEQHGAPRDWHTSEDALLVQEVVGPEIPDLTDTDSPDLIPPQVQKYLRFAVLEGAWQQQGEGRQPALAELCSVLVARGIRLLQVLGDLARYDRDMQRAPVGESTRYRPPRVQLPSTYPRVWAR